MSQLGTQLRAAREDQGISLSQAAIETRILQRYLVALEDGAYQSLPGDVYARGFVRNYATYLGLPAEDIVELYRRERGVTEPIRVVPATTPQPQMRSLFVPSFIGVFFVVLVLVAVAYLTLSLTNRIGENSQIAVAESATAFPTPLPLPTVPPVVPTSAAPAPTDAVAAAPTPEPIAGGAAPTASIQPETTAAAGAPILFEVQIQAGDSPGSWLSIDIDGQRVFREILAPGKALQYGAQRSVQMRAGNAGVVSVFINGQPQPPLGGPNEAVTFVWPPQP